MGIGEETRVESKISANQVSTTNTEKFEPKDLWGDPVTNQRTRIIMSLGSTVQTEGRPTVEASIARAFEKYRNTDLNGKKTFGLSDSFLHLDDEGNYAVTGERETSNSEAQNLLKKVSSAAKEYSAVKKYAGADWKKEKEAFGLRQAVENLWRGSVRAYSCYTRPSSFFGWRSGRDKESIARTAHAYAAAEVAMGSLNVAEKAVSSPPYLTQESLQDLEKVVDEVDRGWLGKASTDSEKINETKLTINEQIQAYEEVCKLAAEQDKSAIQDHIKALRKLSARVEKYEKSFKCTEARIDSQTGTSFSSIKSSADKAKFQTQIAAQLEAYGKISVRLSNSLFNGTEQSLQNLVEQGENIPFHEADSKIIERYQELKKMQESLKQSSLQAT
ncbi:MAG: hypothetical protein WCK42_03990 [Myxococcaceae bacterium]